VVPKESSKEALKEIPNGGASYLHPRGKNSARARREPAAREYRAPASEQEFQQATDPFPFIISFVCLFEVVEELGSC
jgi:hypothetical protein